MTFFDRLSSPRLLEAFCEFNRCSLLPVSNLGSPRDRGWGTRKWSRVDINSCLLSFFTIPASILEKERGSCWAPDKHIQRGTTAPSLSSLSAVPISWHIQTSLSLFALSSVWKDKVLRFPYRTLPLFPPGPIQKTTTGTVQAPNLDFLRFFDPRKGISSGRCDRNFGSWFPFLLSASDSDSAALFPF